jgi:hypothetical protein
MEGAVIAALVAVVIVLAYLGCRQWKKDHFVPSSDWLALWDLLLSPQQLQAQQQAQQLQDQIWSRQMQDDQRAQNDQQAQ